MADKYQNKELLEFYQSTIRELFKVTAVADAVKDTLKGRIEHRLLKKYEDDPIFHNGKEYKLYGVNFWLFNNDVEFRKSEYHCEFTYFIVKQSPKEQIKIREMKDTYIRRNKCIGTYSKAIRPLFIVNDYYLTLDEAIDETLNLEIK